MLGEILEVLDLKPGDAVVDGTLGLAGHSREFARRVAPGGVLVGFDWDRAMLEHARERLGAPEGVTVHLVNDDFRTMAEHLEELKVRPDGILLDLGLNSAQVDDPERGISFLQEGPLDMRMDRDRGESAAAMLNRMAPGEIERLLQDFGDERWARMIAKRIVERRREKPLRTTTDLVECVRAAIPAGAREKRIHPATRTFQAVRIAVNGELDDLDEGLERAARALAPQGVLAVLSYHSGEDRFVKQTFRALAEEGFEDLYRKPRVPTESEIARNPRARSAKLRALKAPG